MQTLVVRRKKSFIERTWGIIGLRKPEAIFLKTRFGIHTFGLRFPIDVVVLDKNNEVIKFKKSLKKNRVFFWPPFYDKVLELPSGSIDKKKIKIKEVINIKFKIGT